MAVVSDRKVVKAVGSDISYYADLVSSTDYYAFGMVMADRSFNTEGYRYGFNGKENDNEVKGTGNQQDYGMRIYDARLGRFLSVDPLTKDYPSWSPYPFAMNRPIDGVDLDGLEFIEAPSGQLSQMKIKEGTTQTITKDGIEKTIYYAKDLTDRSGWIMEVRLLETNEKQSFHYAADTKMTTSPLYWKMYDQFSYNKELNQTADNIGIGANYVAATLATGGLAVSGGIGVGLNSLSQGARYLGNAFLKNIVNPSNIASGVSDGLSQTIGILSDKEKTFAKDFNINSTISQLAFGGKFAPLISSLASNTFNITLKDGFSTNNDIKNNPLKYVANVAIGTAGNAIGGLSSMLPLKSSFGQFAASFLSNTFGNAVGSVAQQVGSTPEPPKDTNAQNSSNN